MDSDRPQDEADRPPIELPVTYPTLNAFLGDYLKNIRRGGTFIPTKKPLPVGTDFLFKLAVPSLNEPLVLEGRVQWRVEAAQARATGRLAGMGIGFVFASEADRLRVDAAVERLMSERLGPQLTAKLLGGAAND